MAKRALEEVEEFVGVGDVSHPSPNAKIHGIVNSLSPMKKSKNCAYFDGEICDGKRSLRIFGFDSSVRRKLVDFEEGSTAVALSHCEVKRSRKGEQLEILVTKHTVVEKSEQQIEVDSVRKASCSANGKTIKLEEVQGLVPFQRVCCEVKVVNVDAVMEVSGGKKKQDVLVGDSTGTVRVTVWESEIGKLEENGSYRLTAMMVREFRGKKFLSTSKDKSGIESISDIGVVEEGEDDSESSSIYDNRPTELHDVRVGGVQLDSYSGCIKCTAKVVPDPKDPELGNCVKCHTMQLMEDCKQELSAQLLIKVASGHLPLRAFSKTLQDIAQKTGADVTQAALLKAKPFTLFHQDGIIQSVVRKV